MKKKRRQEEQRRKQAASQKLRPLAARKEIDLNDLEAIMARAATLLPAGDVDTLRATVDTLVALTQELEMKGASILRLRHLLFGPRTESKKRVFPDAPGGGEKSPDSTDEAKDGESPDATDEAKDGESPDATGSEDAGPDAGDASSKPKRKGHGRNGASDFTGAEKIPVPHEALQHGACCPECARGKVYIQSEPARLIRIRGMAPVSATVYEKDRLRCNGCGEVFTARSPEGVGDEKYDASVGVMIVQFKYGAAMPFYRLERLQKSMGIPLPTSTQWDLVEVAANQVTPLVEELLRVAAQGKLLHDDDTTMRVLKLDRSLMENALTTKDGKERTGVFTSGIVSVGDTHKIALFFTGVRHAGENLEKVLKERIEGLPIPIQMCDALSWNTKSAIPTLVANCLAHGRRHFVEFAKYFPEKSLFVIDVLADIYEHDAEARDQKMSDDERLLHHQTHSGPRMEELQTWLDKQINERLIEPNSAFGGAIQYMRNHWKKLTLFLRVPGAALDNNICERALKRAVLHRKNSLFYATLNGARVGDAFMSLIHTCELNDVNTFDYLLAALRNSDDLVLRAKDWMPWNYKIRLAELTAPDA